MASAAQSMKVIGITRPGDFDVLEKFDLPKPVPKPGEILIKVEYAGVNANDMNYRKGIDPLGWLPPLPAALGVECSGTVVALPADEGVLSNSNEEFKRRNYKVGSRVVVCAMGAFAEYMAVAWELVYPLPENVSTRDAAAVFVQGMTAHTFISESYPVQRGEHVLVHTVAGGCGLYFTQLVKARGGIVIGTTSTREKAAFAKERGADHVVLYKDEDVVARTLEITNGEGVHAVFDGVGKDTFEDDFKLVRTNGTVVLYGFTSGLVENVSPFLLLRKNAKLTVATMANCVSDPTRGREYFEELCALVADGTVEVVVQEEYPFTAEGMQEAQKALAGGKSVGKLLVKVA